MAEPDNLILSILREMRADMSSFRSEMTEFRSSVDQRLEALETKTDGLAVLLAGAFGHLSHEVTALSTRVDALEPAKG
jgi:hypothetical protein